MCCVFSVKIINILFSVLSLQSPTYFSTSQLGVKFSSEIADLCLDVTEFTAEENLCTRVILNMPESLR